MPTSVRIVHCFSFGSLSNLCTYAGPKPSKASCGNNGWVGAPLSRLRCVQFFLVLYFNLKSWEVGCIYLFIYLLLSSPCVLLYHMGGHQNLYGPYMCVCVCFSLGYFLLLIDLSWCCSWDVFILVYYFGAKNYKHSPNIWSHQKMKKESVIN